MTRRPRRVFVTGTDTGVGKTVAAVALLRALRATGARVVGMKPVAAGVEPPAQDNADVIALAAAGNVAAPRDAVNPYCFAEAIAPHVAAAREGRRIELAVLRAAFDDLAARADAVVIEGAGGALVPIDEQHDMLDVAGAFDAPVLLVVGIRLGCLNHALLSALAVRRRGLRLAGWIAARIDSRMPAAQASVHALIARLPAPLLGDFASPQDVAFGPRELVALDLVSASA